LRTLSSLITHSNFSPHFWNFFSAFVIRNERLMSQLEGVLIAAMPTANGESPKLPKPSNAPGRSNPGARDTAGQSAGAGKILSHPTKVFRH